MGFERARSTRSSPADASTATTEHSEGVRRAARRGMPSGRGLSVVVYSSLPLFSSHPPQRRRLPHNHPSTFISPSRSSPHPALRSPRHSRTYPHSRNIVIVSPHVPVYHPPASSSPRVFCLLEFPVDHRYRTRRSSTSSIACRPKRCAGEPAAGGSSVFTRDVFFLIIFYSRVR